MARVVLVTTTPRDPATGAAVVQYLAGGGGRRHHVYKGRGWQSGIAARPRFRAAIGWDDKGWTGGVVPTTGTIRFAPSSTAALDRLADLYWEGAPILIETGAEPADDAEPAWTTELVGTVAGHAVADGFIVLTVGDLGIALSRPLVSDRFAGTGGIEGGSEAVGRLKRRSWGRVYNVEGKIYDKAYNLYEFGDPAHPLAAIATLRDIGRFADPAPAVLPWQGSAAATLAALRDAQCVAGSGVVAPSIAIAKWWTQPMLLTGDVDGEIGAGYVETAPEIAARVLAMAGATTIDNVAEAVAIRPAIVGIHVDSADETCAQLLDRLLLGVSLFAYLQATGTIRLLDFRWSDPVEALDVRARTRQRTYPPMATRRIGYQRSYRIHSDGEIASSILGADISWPDVTDPTGTKPVDNATNSADPASPFGPAGTVATTLARLGEAQQQATDGLSQIAAARVVLAATQTELDATLAQAQATAAVARQTLLAALGAQLLDERRSARVEALTHLDGVKVGVAIRQETTQRVDGELATARTFALLGAVNGTGDAFVLDGSSVYVDPAKTLAQRFGDIEADYAGVSGTVAANVTRLDQAVATADQASAQRDNQIRVDYDGVLAATNARITTSDTVLADEIGARATAISQLDASLRLDVGNLVNARVATLNQAIADESGARASQYDGIAVRLSGVDGAQAAASAAIDDLRQATVSGDQSLAQQISGLSSAFANDLGLANASLLDVRQAVTNADQASAQRDNQIRVDYDGVLATTNARITSSDTAITNEIGARATAITQLDVSLRNDLGGLIAANVATLSQAIVDEAGARSSQYTSVTARMDNIGGGGASVEQLFSATADAIGGLKARASLAVTAGGVWSGIVVTAQDGSAGTVSDITLSAMTINVSTAKLIFNSGTVMKVLGTGFGVGNEFVEWFGPSMPIAQCARANGIQWQTTNGDAYFGGSLTAGALKNGNQSSAIDTNVSADTGVFGSNGRRITVVVSWIYQCTITSSYPATQAGKQAFNATAANYGATEDNNWSGTRVETGPATVTLARGLSGTALSDVASVTAPSGSAIFGGAPPIPAGGEPGFSQIEVRYAASLTYSDPDLSALDRQFRASLARDFLYNGAVSQRLTITTVEE